MKNQKIKKRKIDNSSYVIQYKGGLKSGRIIELSEEGISCLVSDKLEIGISVTLKMNLSKSLMEIRCRIKKVEPEGSLFRAYLKFTYLNEEYKEIIKQYIRDMSV